MEGHGGLPSAADVQGKSPPLPPALPPGPVRGACGASPSRCLSLPTFLNPCAWLTPRRSSPRETTCNWKTKSHPPTPKEPMEPN